MNTPFMVEWPLTRRHRVAVAGLGGVARGAHLPAYAKLGPSLGIDVVGGADPVAACRDEVAASHGIPVFASVGELLAAVEPEVVDVAVPPGPAKNAVIEECLAAGCHVLAQKPFTKDLPSAVALVEAAERAGRLLAVNVQARFAPAFRAARELIAEGRIGPVLSASLHSTFPLPGDTTIDMGIHEVDLLRFWTGLDPVRARATVTPLAGERSHHVIEVDFGAAAGLVVEENHAPVVRPWTFRIVGADGVIEGREQFGTVEPAEVVVHTADGSVAVPLGYAYVPDAFAHVLASLLHAVETGGPAPTAAADHLPSLAGVLAASRSVSSGAFEKVETT
jgi:predicted dehydrogenase